MTKDEKDFIARLKENFAGFAAGMRMASHEVEKK